MKATWNGKVLAESEETIMIEGNQYFPADAINQEFFTKNDEHTVCPWKGTASYYDLEVDGQVNKGAAWYYDQPKEGSIERVGKDFTNYIAFWRGVEVA